MSALNLSRVIDAMRMDRSRAYDMGGNERNLGKYHHVFE